MKRAITILLFLILVLTLCACGSSQTAETPNTESTSNPAEEPHTNELALEEFIINSKESTYQFKLRNLTDEKMDSALFSGQILDANGDILGDIGGSTELLEPGQAVTKSNWGISNDISIGAISKIKIYSYEFFRGDDYYKGTFDPVIMLDLTNAKKENGNYLFSLVAQSDNISRDEAWEKLFSYIETYGDSSDTQNYLETGETANFIQKSYTNGNTQIAIVPTDNDRILLYACIYKASEFNGNKFSTFRQLTLTLHAGSTTANYDMLGVSSDTMTGGTSYEHGTGELDITTANADTILDVGNYEYTDIAGNVTNEEPGADLVQFFNDLYQDIVTDTPEILEGTGLGITMGMLGFESME